MKQVYLFLVFVNAALIPIQIGLDNPGMAIVATICTAIFVCAAARAPRAP